MDGVSASTVAQSVETLNNVLQMASMASIEQAEKLMQMTTEMALASMPGMGEQVDVLA